MNLQRTHQRALAHLNRANEILSPHHVMGFGAPALYDKQLPKYDSQTNRCSWTPCKECSLGGRYTGRCHSCVRKRSIALASRNDTKFEKELIQTFSKKQIDYMIGKTATKAEDAAAAKPAAAKAKAAKPVLSTAAAKAKAAREAAAKAAAAREAKAKAKKEAAAKAKAAKAAAAKAQKEAAAKEAAAREAAAEPTARKVVSKKGGVKQNETAKSQWPDLPADTVSVADKKHEEFLEALKEVTRAEIKACEESKAAAKKATKEAAAAAKAAKEAAAAAKAAAAKEAAAKATKEAIIMSKESGRGLLLQWRYYGLWVDRQDLMIGQSVEAPRIEVKALITNPNAANKRQLKALEQL